MLATIRHPAPKQSVLIPMPLRPRPTSSPCWFSGRPRSLIHNATSSSSMDTESRVKRDSKLWCTSRSRYLAISHTSSLLGVDPIISGSGGYRCARGKSTTSAIDRAQGSPGAQRRRTPHRIHRAARYSFKNWSGVRAIVASTPGIAVRGSDCETRALELLPRRCSRTPRVTGLVLKQGLPLQHCRSRPESVREAVIMRLSDIGAARPSPSAP